MKKKNNVATTRFSIMKQFSFCTLFESVYTGKYREGIIKAILMISIVCCLQTIGCGKEANDNIKSTKPSTTEKAVENKPFDFAEVLQLYSTYALDYRVFSRYIPVSYAKGLFKRVESAEQIEQLLKNYDGKSIKIPYDLNLDIIVEDDYDTNGIGIVFTMPFRCYAKPLNTNKNIKRVDLNNTTTPFSSDDPYSNIILYIKSPSNNLVLVDFLVLLIFVVVLSFTIQHT